MKNKQFRQGDLLIEQVDNVPEKLEKKNSENGRTVLAHGEVTGHHHSLLEDEADLYDASEAWKIEGDLEDVRGLGRAALKVKKSESVTHQEHGPIPLKKKSYRVTRQREYSPEAIRNVAD